MVTWKHKWTHYIGVSSSLLCLIHCLAMPLILLVFPTLLHLDLSSIDSFWEFVFVGLSVTSVLTIINVHKTHNHFSAALPIAFIGVLNLTISLYLNHKFAIYFMMTGSLMILVAHLLNYRLCRRHENCSHSKSMIDMEACSQPPQ
jgi:hypothetical protein